MWRPLKRLSFLSLRLQIYLTVGAAWLIMAVIFTAVYIPYQNAMERAVSRRIEQFVNQIIKQQEDNIAAEMYLNHTHALRLHLEKLKSIEEIVDADAFRRDRTLLATTRALPRPPEAPAIKLRRVPNRPPYVMSVPVRLDAGHGMAFVHTVFLDHEVLGYIQIVYDMSDMIGYTRTRGRLFGFFFLLIAVATAIILHFFLQRVILRPIGMFDRVIEQQRHNEEAAVRLPGQNELTRLADRFNELTRERRAAFAELARLNRQLEDRVSQRTREIETANKELTAAKQASEEANRMKTYFLANISHELRTPLNGIVGAADMLALRGGTERECNYVTIIRRSAKRLLYMFNHLIDMAGLHSRKVALNIHDFATAQLVSDTVDVYRPLAQSRGLEFETRLSPDLPSHLSGDAFRIQQVLDNLLSNAIKFSDAGKLGLSVEPWGEEYIAFSVHDEGVGIDEADRKRIFDAFEQGEAGGGEDRSGSGLGLAISQELALLMGGRIEVESRRGTGSTFRLLVPRREGTAPKAGEPKRWQPRLYWGRVLVVDDDETNTAVAADILRSFGLTVETAQSGDEALRRLEKRFFDAIFLDIRMPGTNGFDVVRAVRRQLGGEGDVPLIAVTAYDSPQRHEEIFNAGFDRYLVKPITQEDFARTLAECDLPKKEGDAARLPDDLVGEKRAAWLKRDHPEHYRRLRERLRVFIGEEQQTIERFLDSRDHDRLGSLLHRYKGIMGNIGFDQGVDLIRELEVVLVPPVDWNAVRSGCRVLARETTAVTN